ncbi:MAG: propanediol utilization protein, partial [Acholeplasmatales bacterium]|nr:propanediol utilization protein [Acholeplasmatales bacterium]
SCSILGPCRNVNQVEVSFTDARTLGVTAPIRESGDVKGSAPCKLVGPAGEVELEDGVIVAKRHIHMTPADAADFGVENGQIVSVKVLNETGRKIVLEDTVVRVSPSYALAMHIDTDEANAGALFGAIKGTILK